MPVAKAAPFWPTGVLVVGLSGILLALLWPVTLHAIRAESKNLVAIGERASGNEANADFQLARWLDHSNMQAALDYAQVQLKDGQPKDALGTLAGVGESPLRDRLMLRTQLELGETHTAATMGNQLAQVSIDQNDLLLAALAELVDHQSASALQISSRITDSKPLQAAQSAQASQEGLGLQLAAIGLQNASEGILSVLPSSFVRDYTLAQIYFQQGTVASLTSAETLATAATDFVPTDQPARQLLINILTAERKTDLASQQTQLLNQLKIGKP